jgi:glycosyltransferase involved in cell wall biosynthesis
VVTSLPDTFPSGWLRSFFFSALTRGDRVIAPSSHAAERAIAQFKIPAERIAVIPRSIDTRLFDAAAVDPHRLTGFDQAARIHRGEKIILVPGRLTAAKGQHVLVEAAALLAARGLTDCVYVFAGDDQSDRLYVRKLMKRIREVGLEPSFRIISTFDLQAALAAAHLVVIPALQPAVSGRILVQAQAMARPVIATQVGIYAEQVLAPPRMPDELRTGWLVRPGQPADLAGAIGAAMTLDETAYQALAARAHHYARFAFSPESVVAATRAVYTGLLAGQG